MWFLVGATSCHVVFSGGHISPCGFSGGHILPCGIFSGGHVVFSGATSCHVVFFLGATSWSARVAPRQGRPLSPPGKLFLRVPERQSPPGVARRPRQGQVAHHPTVYRLDRRDPRLSSGVRCRPSAPGPSAGPARVVRRPRQGGLPSSCWECGF